jgi:hypothetical protein
MQKLIAFLIVLIFGIAPGFSQSKKNPSKWVLHSINNVGLLEGQAGSALQLQTINGVKYKSWFAGLGVGLDYYRFRTIPLFVDIRKEFGKKQDKFFVYGDAGMNFYWKRDKDPKQFYINDKFKNGFYGELGAGYKIKISGNALFSLSFGYSFKKLGEEGQYGLYTYPMFPQIGTAEYLSNRIDYRLNRLVIKMGIEF